MWGGAGQECRGGARDVEASVGTWDEIHVRVACQRETLEYGCGSRSRYASEKWNGL